jgi:hypothetical protein
MPFWLHDRVLGIIYAVRHRTFIKNIRGSSSTYMTRWILLSLTLSLRPEGLWFKRDIVELVLLALV